MKQLLEGGIDSSGYLLWRVTGLGEQVAAPAGGVGVIPGGSAATRHNQQQRADKNAGHPVHGSVLKKNRFIFIVSVA
jgi:hypothetical protein